MLSTLYSVGYRIFVLFGLNAYSMTVSSLYCFIIIMHITIRDHKSLQNDLGIGMQVSFFPQTYK